MHHLGQDVWLTRKGAIKAGVGHAGVIRGSMCGRSYMVRGRSAALRHEAWLGSIDTSSRLGLK